MSKRILVDASYPEETRIAVLENRKLMDFDYESNAKPQLKGNIYLAKITRVEPSLQAAFIDYGHDKHGFLPFSEIHPSYYNIPVNDRSKQDKKDLDNNLTESFVEITPPDLTDIEDIEKNNNSKNRKRRNKKSSDINNNDQENIVNLAEENSDDQEIPNKIMALEVDDNLSEELKIIEENTDEEIDKFFDEDENNIRTLYQKYKIQEVIKKNQVILVQVIKEERGNKGASFTSYISLAGRYCVLMPNSERQGGISRRVVDLEKRKRLKEVIDNLSPPEGVSVIIRTAGEDRSKAEIKRDYDYLVRLWNNIREHTIASKAPTFIHAESDIIKRIVRDTFDEDTKELFISGQSSYSAMVDFAKRLAPGIEKKIKLYNSKTPIFHKFGVEENISSFYGQISQLESGGYLVLNHTEALTSIDVNSGRSTSERNIEETALKTNLEAAKEIARQLRLRDISGLIVIDFIDMMDYQNRKQVEKVFREAIKGDKARIQISSISPFGLVEMSRQRLKSSFIENNTVICNHCNGKGRIRNPEANALVILRNVENEVSSGDFQEAIIYAHIDVVMYLLNFKRDHIRYIEEKHSIKIQVQREFDISVDSYSIERILRTDAKIKDSSPTVDEEDIILDDINAYEEEDDEEVINKESSDGEADSSKKFRNNRNGNFRGKSSTKYGKRTSNFYKKRRRNFDKRKDETDKTPKTDSWWKRLFS